MTAYLVTMEGVSVVSATDATTDTCYGEPRMKVYPAFPPRDTARYVGPVFNGDFWTVDGKRYRVLNRWETTEVYDMLSK